MTSVCPTTKLSAAGSGGASNAAQDLHLHERNLREIYLTLRQLKPRHQSAAMKPLRLVFPLLLATTLIAAAGDKQLWADSFLDKKAPDFVVEKWISQEPALKGKFLLIDYWATWCGPCRKAIPELNSFYKKFGDQIVVIGISDEPEAKVRAMKEPVIEYASAIDTKGRMKKALGVRGIPHVILVDPQGIVRWEGFPLLEGHELTEKVIQEVLYQDVARAKLCATFREQISAAKQLWAKENSQPATNTPGAAAVAAYLKDNKLPACPVGGNYTLGPVNQPPVCSIHGGGKP